MPKLVIYECDDWVRAFLDGKEIEDGHDFSPETLARALGIEVEKHWHDDPDTFDDVVPRGTL